MQFLVQTFYNFMIRGTWMKLDAPNKLYVLKMTPLPNKIGNNIVHRSGKHILWHEEMESKKS
jgi:hypothetical protein